MLVDHLGQSHPNILFSILSREISAYSCQFSNPRFWHGAQTILNACEGRVPVALVIRTLFLSANIQPTRQILNEAYQRRSEEQQ
jgi:hypothetical protein